MPDVITGSTQLGPTKNEIIAALVQKELKFQAKLLPFASDVSAFAGKGMKSISFPKLASFTVQNRASAVAGDIQTLASSIDTLDLDVNAYVSWLIDSSDLIQSSIEAKMEFAKRAATAHARYVDTNLIAALNGGYFNTPVGGPITAAKILDLRKQLLKENADMNKMVLAVSPDEEEDMLALTEFSHADVYGQAVIPNGVIGKVYGIPVIVHNGLAAGEAYMWDKDGLVIGFQLGANYAAQPEIAYGTTAMREAVDQLFGVMVSQQGVGSAAAGKSPLIVKL